MSYCIVKPKSQIYILNLNIWVEHDFFSWNVVHQS